MLRWIKGEFSRKFRCHIHGKMSHQLNGLCKTGVWSLRQREKNLKKKMKHTDLQFFLVESTVATITAATATIASTTTAITYGIKSSVGLSYYYTGTILIMLDYAHLILNRTGSPACNYNALRNLTSRHVLHSKAKQHWKNTEYTILINTNTATVSGHPRELKKVSVSGAVRLRELFP